jgi:hypothetical protein
MSKLDPDELYHRLGRLIEETPEIKSGFDVETVDAATLQWLGRAYALIRQGLGTAEAVAFQKQMDLMITSSLTRESYVPIIHATLQRALAVAEMDAPTASKGAFIPVGSSFVALTEITKIFATATTDVLLVDPYMDEKTLTDFAVLIAEDRTVRLMSDAAFRKPGLEPAARTWVAQYGTKRPLQLRSSPPRTLHDRLIVVDRAQVWVLTQSFNAIARRSPASIVRVDAETAALKIESYEVVWAGANPVIA